MPNFRLSPLITESVSDTVCLEGGEQHRMWAHIYYGAVFPCSQWSAFPRTVIVQHRNWWVTPEHMSDREFDIASATFQINIREIAAQIEAGLLERAGVFVSATSPSLLENPERIASEQQLSRRRGPRPRYVPDNIVEPLPLP